MRRLFILLAAATLCIQGAARNAADQIKEILAGNRVSISYSYSDSAGNELGKGLATIQGHCYKVTESGTSYYCDGTTLWTEIPRSKEVYIENGGGPADIFGNLESIMDNVTDLVLDGTRVSFRLTMPGIPEPVDCKATILRKTEYSEDMKDFRADMSKYDRLWTITDLR